MMGGKGVYDLYTDMDEVRFQFPAISNIIHCMFHEKPKVQRTNSTMVSFNTYKCMCTLRIYMWLVKGSGIHCKLNGESHKSTNMYVYYRSRFF